MSKTIVLTDYPWPDVNIETDILQAAGYSLIAAQCTPGDARAVETLVAAHDPIAIMTCWAQVSARAIAIPTQLKVVARLGVGLDNIAIDAATARGAWVTNVPDYCVEEVSDHAIAMLLAHWRGLHWFDQEVKAGRWQPSTALLTRARTRTVGIIGYGKIGRLTARKLAVGFGCRVLIHSPSLLRERGEGCSLTEQLTVASLAQIQSEADAIILHVPLTPATQHLVDAAFLKGCRRKPIIVNVSRGGLIDNRALLYALAEGLIAGAALDVIEGEPNPPPELVGRRDVIVTPHVAFNSDAALRELRERCTQDVVRALRGERPLHPCNQPSHRE